MQGVICGGGRVACALRVVCCPFEGADVSEAERLGQILIDRGWPTTKDEAAALRDEVLSSQRENEWSVQLRLIDKLLCQARLLVKMRSFGVDRQRFQIMEVIRKITEAAK
jgi:hypothetical protein